MQKIVHGSSKFFIPAGWAALKAGEPIKAGDRFFEIDTHMWKDASVVDVGSKVLPECDVVIRRSDAIFNDQKEPNASRVYVIPEDY